MPAPLAADEASAEVARRRLHERGIVPIEPDDRVGGMLAPDEAVVSVRRAVSLERRTGWQDPAAAVTGDLYVTTQRLLHLGRVRIECPVGAIRDALISDRVLLLLVGDDRGLTVHVDDPRLLRVEIAAARGAARRSGGGAGWGPPSEPEVPAENEAAPTGPAADPEG